MTDTFTNPTGTFQRSGTALLGPADADHYRVTYACEATDGAA